MRCCSFQKFPFPWNLGKFSGDRNQCQYLISTCVEHDGLRRLGEVYGSVATMATYLQSSICKSQRHFFRLRPPSWKKFRCSETSRGSQCLLMPLCPCQYVDVEFSSSSFLYLCISISLLRPYTLFSRSPLVNKTLFFSSSSSTFDHFSG